MGSVTRIESLWTPQRFVKTYPNLFSIRQIRDLVKHGEENGFSEVIVRYGPAKVHYYLDVDKLQKWINTKRGNACLEASPKS